MAKDPRPLHRGRRHPGRRAMVDYAGDSSVVYIRKHTILGRVKALLWRCEASYSAFSVSGIEPTMAV